jgi:nicotinate-nucleotide adenylyltransferase
MLGDEGLSPLQLFFIIGNDAFAEIASWHQYPHLLDFAHFVVVSRPGMPLERVRHQVPALWPRLSAPDEEADFATPRIFLVQSNTPDVSSTDIRHRASRGEPLDNLVPSAVASYIAETRLYASGP